ncbi:hypothetical protein KI387_012393 [Taxus chinensis]|uniref:Uncharacterized protein n=1 Tax=Taxus chinensis TaxID=29808 RepID=A0AA38CI31_TAXCH|nr:hypothetical protein KI387_012393 [Taxus chinensis]
MEQSLARENKNSVLERQRSEIRVVYEVERWLEGITWYFDKVNDEGETIHKSYTCIELEIMKEGSRKQILKQGQVECLNIFLKAKCYCIIRRPKKGFDKNSEAHGEDVLRLREYEHTFISKPELVEDTLRIKVIEDDKQLRNDLGISNEKDNGVLNTGKDGGVSQVKQEHDNEACENTKEMNCAREWNEEYGEESHWRSKGSQFEKNLGIEYGQQGRRLWGSKFVEALKQRPDTNPADYDKHHKEALLLLKPSVSDDLISEVQNATVAGDLWTSL